jgi:HSF-type DNA-binding
LFRTLLSWFRHSNYNSFQRQLNIYGFHRFTEGRDKNAYYHENFVRGAYEQTLNIERNAVKGTSVRRPSNVTSLFDFYQEQHQRETDVISSSRSESLTESLVANILSNTQPGTGFSSAHRIDNATTQYHIINGMAHDVIRNQNVLPTCNSTLEAALITANRNNYESRQNLLIPNNNAINELFLNHAQLPVVPRAQADFPRLNPTRAEVLLRHGGLVRHLTIDRFLRGQLQQHQQSRNDVQMPLFSSAGSNNPSINTAISPEILELLRQSLRNPRGSDP